MNHHFLRTVWMSVITIAGSFILFGVGLVFFGNDLTLQARRVADGRATLRVRTRAIDMLATLKQIAPQVTAYQSQMDALLPPKDALVEFQRAVEGLARVNRMTANFAFQGSAVPPRETAPGYLNFSLDLAGSYDNLRGFLTAFELQSTKFLVSIDKAEVSYSPDSGGYRALTRGKVFFK